MCDVVQTGDPGVSRTRDLSFRKRPLYPSELRGRDLLDTYHSAQASNKYTVGR